MQFANLLFDDGIQSHDKKHNNEAPSQIFGLIENGKEIRQSIQSYIEQTDCNLMIDVNAPIQKYIDTEDYYQRFFRTYTVNQMLIAHLKFLTEQTIKLKQSVEQADKLYKDHAQYIKLKNKKKNRRMAVEIVKDYTCPYDNCYKIYGSDVSLNLHIKIKHGGGNKSDRDKLAHQICMAEINGYVMPKFDINLPPGYLEQYRNKFSAIKNTNR